MEESTKTVNPLFDALAYISEAQALATVAMVAINQTHDDLVMVVEDETLTNTVYGALVTLRACEEKMRDACAALNA